MAKTDDKGMASFRIADLRRPEVKSFTKAGEQPAADTPSESVGFATVEERLEKGTIESVAEELRPSYEKLEQLANGTDAKLKGPAKKAMAAYERVADLFEYLFETKQVLQSSVASTPPASPGSKKS